MAGGVSYLKILGPGQACCGCGACAARCPAGCIAMGADPLGFPYPSVDHEACVGCGGCDAACPALNAPEEDGCLSVFWAKAKDAELLGRSSSGGAFGLLASGVLARGGIVVGAAWAEGCRRLRHVVVEDATDLDSVLRSKYVQSTVERGIYEGVRAALRDRCPALFCGTACQVAGMRSYLGGLANSDLFLGVDVICHGVPSPELWRRWLDYVESRECGVVREVNFRSKITGWLSFSVMYKYITEKDSASRSSANRFAEDWYMRAFLKNASLRPSCLVCPFKRRCGSDVTLGDYWGIGRQHPGVSVEGGVSAVIANTEKGLCALRSVSGGMELGGSSFGKVAAGNPALVRPAAPHPERDLFLRMLADGASIPEMADRWGFEPTLGQKLVSKAKGTAKRLLGRS